MTPDALVAGGATFVALASAIIAAFMAGKIVAGKTYDHQVEITERLAAALERQNELAEIRERERLMSRARKT